VPLVAEMYGCLTQSAISIASVGAASAMNMLLTMAFLRGALSRLGVALSSGNAVMYRESFFQLTRMAEYADRAGPINQPCTWALNVCSKTLPMSWRNDHCLLDRARLCGESYSYAMHGTSSSSLVRRGPQCTETIQALEVSSTSLGRRASFPGTDACDRGVAPLARDAAPFQPSNP
jgi:hypothetical protein